jgi:hypothetical protein
MKTLHSKHLITGFIVLGLLVAAIELYPVRELVAAWVIFSILFAAAATILLLLVLVEEATLKGVILFETLLVRVQKRNTEASVLPHREPGKEATVSRMASLSQRIGSSSVS